MSDKLQLELECAMQEAQAIVAVLDNKIAQLDHIVGTTTSDLSRRMAESHAIKLRIINHRIRLGMRAPDSHKVTFNAEDVREIMKAIV